MRLALATNSSRSVTYEQLCLCAFQCAELLLPHLHTGLMSKEGLVGIATLSTFSKLYNGSREVLRQVLYRF